jgi:hypothetical protein
VQIVEANDHWVRVAELRLQRPDTPMRFVLYPMLHIGSPDFYREVNRRLRSAEVIVTEGVGENRYVRGLTRGYRSLGDDARLGLMVQHLDYAATGAEVIRPDMSAAQFEARWRTVPLRQRSLTWLAAGMVQAGGRLMGGDRLLREIVAGSSLEDLPTNEELQLLDVMPDIDRVLLDERDALVVQSLKALYERRSAEPITVAVVYGAMHMRAIATGLRALGYRVRSGDWLTAVVLD